MEAVAGGSDELDPADQSEPRQTGQINTRVLYSVLLVLELFMFVAVLSLFVSVVAVFVSLSLSDIVFV